MTHKCQFYCHLLADETRDRKMIWICTFEKLKIYGQGMV